MNTNNDEGAANGPADGIGTERAGVTRRDQVPRLRVVHLNLCKRCFKAEPYDGSPYCLPCESVIIDGLLDNFRASIGEH